MYLSEARFPPASEALAAAKKGLMGSAKWKCYPIKCLYPALVFSPDDIDAAQAAVRVMSQRSINNSSYVLTASDSEPTKEREAPKEKEASQEKEASKEKKGSKDKEASKEKDLEKGASKEREAAASSKTPGFYEDQDSHNTTSEGEIFHPGRNTVIIYYLLVFIAEMLSFQ